MSLCEPTSLSTSNVLLESLFATLITPPTLSSDLHATTGPPTISPAAKPTLLTLHALFPTLLLPALDLLDRRLVARFTQRDEALANSNEAAAATSRDEGGTTLGKRIVYFVKSNAHRDGRSRYGRGGADVGGTSYEVRTGAWSCTCAAFAFSAFNGEGASPTYGSYDNLDDYEGRGAGKDEDEEMLDGADVEGVAEGNEDWRWGGSMLGDEEMPLCKHLLACVLVERWDVGASMVEEREVGKEELAGWAAGWGG